MWDLTFTIAMIAFAVWIHNRIGKTGSISSQIRSLQAEIKELRDELKGIESGSTRGTQRDSKAVQGDTSGEPDLGRIRTPKPGASRRERVPAPPTLPKTPPVIAPPHLKKTSSAPPPQKPRIPKMEIDWEKWLGVRGAAVLGGIVLALAGLYFFRYSIEKGYFTPLMRVMAGTLLGAGCIGFAEFKIREKYATTANALIGGGIAILYASFWAAHSRYDLVPIIPAFVLMLAVTASCTALSWKHRSQVIALIGLIGGFCTPLMVSMDFNEPIGLFGYLLILDGSLIYVGKKRSWPVLAVLSLVATLMYQAVWVVLHIDIADVFLGVFIVGITSLVYLFSGRNVSEEDRKYWMITRCAAILVPVVFTIRFTSELDFGAHFYPVAGLLMMLCAAACWIGHKEKIPWLSLAAASGSVFSYAIWTLETSIREESIAWETSILCILLSAVFFYFGNRFNHGAQDSEAKSRNAIEPLGVAIAVVAALAGLLVIAAALHGRVSAWPWLAGLIGLEFILLGLARNSRFERFQIIGAIALALGISLDDGGLYRDNQTIYYAMLVGTSLLFQLVAMRKRIPTEKFKEWAECSAMTFSGVSVFLLTLHGFHISRFESFPHLVMISGVAFIGILSATRLGSGKGFMLLAFLAALAHTVWTMSIHIEDPKTIATVGLLVQSTTVLLFTIWPFIGIARFRDERWAWRATALIAPVWFLSLRDLYEKAFTDQAIGVLPILLAVVSITAAWRSTQIWSPQSPLRKSNLAWFMTMAFGFITVAVPLQLEKEWITLSWALEGFAVIWLWKRIDHFGLKYFALSLFTVVTVRLVANPAVLEYYLRPEMRILNWMLYTYLVPAAALIASGRMLFPIEVQRLLPAERPFYVRERPLLATLFSGAGLVVVFVWINLAIADWFSTGEVIQFSLHRMPARDLTMSIAWAIYAIALLAIGVRLRMRPLRWVSLIMILITAGKVFLHDLGKLDDLYRVASLLGLAISLIGISLAYQRFVFGADHCDEQPNQDSLPESGEAQ